MTTKEARPYRRLRDLTAARRLVVDRARRVATIQPALETQYVLDGTDEWGEGLDDLVSAVEQLDELLGEGEPDE